MVYDVVVIGAGQAGLVTAHALQKKGLNFLLLEAGERAVGSWPKYYDSLTLFSPARYSSLPELSFTGDLTRYPTRDEVVDYLERYAQHFAFPIHFNTRVTNIQRQDELFCLRTTHTDYFARAVVVASGPFHQPNIPNFKGLTDFKGQVLHSAAYRSPADVLGQRVAVVGAGNSALQIAYELSAMHEVILTSRQAPLFQKQRVLGQDIHFWLKWTGLDTGRWGKWLLGKETPVLDQGKYRQAVESGRIRYQRIFERLTADGLQWSDSSLPIDTLLLATGFSHLPNYINELIGDGSSDTPQQENGIGTTIQGLYFVGMPWQRSHASATLRGVGDDARYVVKHLQRYLKNPQTTHLLQGCC
ncbi:MAG: NAD(P)/FAD-dependent oxidoreductase [Agitococcus sp.]|nr:NAD(P)/FAD-dependent oxidoreductase [Agitococcus sp.]